MHKMSGNWRTIRLKRKTVCLGTFRSLARVSGITLIKLVSNGFNYFQPSVSSFTSADPIKLGSIGLFLVKPLKCNWAELSEPNRVRGQWCLHPPLELNLSKLFKRCDNNNNSCLSVWRWHVPPVSARAHCRYSGSMRLSKDVHLRWTG